MKRVTGFQLLEAIRLVEMELESYQPFFNRSLTSWKPEEATKPTDVADKLVGLMRKKAKLQVALEQYNLKVHALVKGQRMNLISILKEFGIAKRMRSLWLVATEDFDRRGRGDICRDKDTEYVTPMITPENAMEQAETWAQYSSALRGALAQGNSQWTELEMDEELLS